MHTNRGIEYKMGRLFDKGPKIAGSKSSNDF